MIRFISVSKYWQIQLIQVIRIGMVRHVMLKTRSCNGLKAIQVQDLLQGLSLAAALVLTGALVSRRSCL